MIPAAIVSLLAAMGVDGFGTREDPDVPLILLLGDWKAFFADMTEDQIDSFFVGLQPWMREAEDLDDLLVRLSYITMLVDAVDEAFESLPRQDRPGPMMLKFKPIQDYLAAVRSLEDISHRLAMVTFASQRGPLEPQWKYAKRRKEKLGEMSPRHYEGRAARISKGPKEGETWDPDFEKGWHISTYRAAYLVPKADSPNRVEVWSWDPTRLLIRFRQRWRDTGEFSIVPRNPRDLL